MVADGLVLVLAQDYVTECRIAVTRKYQIEYKVSKNVQPDTCIARVIF